VDRKGTVSFDTVRTAISFVRWRTERAIASLLVVCGTDEYDSRRRIREMSMTSGRYCQLRPEVGRIC